MGKLQLLLTLIILMVLTSSGYAKTLGNFKSYKQITDKEILIETTNGSKILVSAYNQYAIGISAFSANETVPLTSPNSINSRKDLNGSIYVEELDELMQITTTNHDGLVIKIDKHPLRFSYINKLNANVLFEELSSVKFGNKNNSINLTIEENEELKLVSNKNHKANVQSIQQGDLITIKKESEITQSANDVCLISSKGYAIVFEYKVEHEINYLKSDKIKISAIGNATCFNYLLIYGPQQPELIDKYAFHTDTNDNQISLK
ncbi:MAG: hypothetical protein ACERKD_18400 [Prolixibacteraceae bacterium]